ncbi:MAG: efflux RND transporter periplasmic adaptor subunit [Candidatus Binatia bacterium]
MPVHAATERIVLPARLACALLVLLAACQPAAEAPAPEIRPVRVIAVEKQDGGETVSLTGTVQAQAEVNLAFRIDGRLVARDVNVGDNLVAGQVVAKLDPQNEQSGLRAARATLSAARGQLTEARQSYERHRNLVAQGVISRAEFERETQRFQTATAQVESATAQVNLAENRLSYAELFADAAGSVTASGAETGEVVQAGRMIVQVARDNGRDAVFDVPAQIMERAPANPQITVALTMDPAVTAIGRVREVAPRADATTGTFRVRVGLSDPPAAMRLGSTVTGRMQVDGMAGIEIPASALTRAERQPAVWVVDAATGLVSARPVEVLRYDPAGVVIGSGLDTGELVVIAGVQALRPGQKVRVLGATP